ncbi:MAG: SDR family oxidoreductase [Phycisphaerae bacterium]|nr:SDR family oxidoreductase [Phycisphaerae bacterium]
MSRSSRPRVVVTGAARRVGRAIALDLAAHGCDLELTCRTSRAELERTADDARAGARAKGHEIDVRLHEIDLADDAAVVALGRDLASRGPLHGLVHNASSYGPATLADVTAADALSHFRVNALAPLLLTQALASSLRQAGGAVVLFSDIHVLGRPRRRFLTYSMSKAAVTDLVATLALELAPTVRVNAIAPGVVAWPDDADPGEVERYEARIPLGRPGTPEDAAGCVRWLLFDAAYVTGEVLRLDGGRWLR